MKKLENCANCNLKIKNGLLNSVHILDKQDVEIINEYEEEKKEGFCNKCGTEKLKEAKEKYKTEKYNLTHFINNNINAIPVTTTHSPLNWNYKVIGIVSGQSSTGTGVVTEFTSDFTDFFGAQSNRHNKKIKKGENLCYQQLRMQTLQQGGNAVIATDIDYSEIGSGRGMLMVCMAGTAIYLDNTDILFKDIKELISKLNTYINRLNYLEKYSYII